MNNMVGGLPWGTVVALLLMVVVPVAALLLYWIDRSQNNGYISIIGRS